jgi:hypothetical protein
MEQVVSRQNNHFAKIAKPYFTIFLIVILSIFLVWLPFIFRIGPEKSEIKKLGFELVQRMYDGPLYAIVAKTLYRSDQINKLHTFDPKYFAIHPPGYPLLIRIVSPIFGYLNGMLIVNVFGAVLLGWTLFYFFDNVLKISEPIYLVVLVLFTPRMLISSVTGSSEIVFILCSILSVILMHKKKYTLASLPAFYASFTRMPGMLLGVAIVIYLVFKLKNFRENRAMVLPMIASFAGFLAICLFYIRQYGDFFAYFNSSVVVQTGIIYSQFFVNAKGIGDKYIEDILFYFGIGWHTLLGKFKTLPPFMSIYAWVMFVFVLTISHREMSRYVLPLIPFLISMQSDFLKKPLTKKVLLLLLPAVYLYIINFISNFAYPLPINQIR